ncbi:MAG: TonB-dependent receptor [Bacteroidetes bacterium]|nr:TonB-dependent receptor [Bacteroidota bacterium]
MKSTLLTLTFVFFALLTWAQPAAIIPSTGKITGVVQDSTNNKGVEFATVALLDPNTQKPVNGEVCDDNGKFTLSKIPSGTYIVSISFIGYATKMIKVQLTDKKNEVNLGNIMLSPSTKLLKTVEIVGQKPLIEERVDRTIYNAENDATSKGGDATDVLRRVPLLTVDMDGNVSLRGSQNLKVLINNKPSTITASSVSDALKQIPADQIKTVEVITSPSAKYDAEGSAGIINIITKKNSLEGLTLNVNSSAGYRGTNLGLNGGYRKGKLGISLGGFGRAQYNTPGDFYNSQKTYNVNRDTVWENRQNASTRNQNLFGNYTLGLDYDIDKNNSLTGSVRFGIRDGHNYQDNLTTLSFINGSEDPNRESIKSINTLNTSHSVDGSLNYTHLFKKPNREFNLLTLYSQSNGENNFITHTTQQSSTATTPEYVKNINPTVNTEATVQADFQTPITDMQLLELGGKEIMRKATSTYNYFQAGSDGVYGGYTGSLYKSNLLDYTQNVTSGYLSYTLSTASKYSFKAGARYEYTTISANNQTQNFSIASYGVLVPSINISKRLGNGNLLKLSFNRRIQRPSIQNLNPNSIASNPTNISTGNPLLSPEYTNNYELGYSVNIKASSLNFSTFVRTTDNAIQQVRSTLPNGVVLTTYENIGVQNAYGASLFANISISNKLSLGGGTDTYYASLKNPGTSDTDPMKANNSGWVYNIRGMGNYNIAKGWGLQFFGFYRGQQVTLQGYQGAFRVYSLSLQKEFNEKRGSIGLGAENFLTPTMKVNSQSISPIVNQTGYNTFYNFNFKVTFNYRIGKLTASQPKRKKSINNDDLKDAGGDQQDGGGQQMGGGQQGGQRGGMQAPPSQPNLKMAAADPSKVVNAEGNWNYTVESPQGGGGKLSIKKEGANYSGTITSTRNNKETPLKSVAVVGNEITITYEVSFGGNTMTFTIKGTIKEDELNGNMSVGQFGTFPINGKREK